MKKYTNTILTTIGFFLIWEIFISLFSIPEFLLPRPTDIFLNLINSIDSLMYHFSITFFEATMGFILAVIIALNLSIIFELSAFTKKSFYPYVIIIRIVPIIAIAPFLILWFGNGIVSKIITSSIMSVFFVIVSLSKGFSEIESDYLDLMKSFSASKWQVLKKLKIPNSLPYLFSGLKMAIATSIAGAVVAEFVGSNNGLGHIILINFYYLKTTQMFAALFLLFIGGIILFNFITFIEIKFFSKYHISKNKPRT